MAATLGVALLHRNRLLALLLTGIIGLITSLAFAWLSAPDLALTQITVEVVTIVLMLLALNYLPKETPRESAPARRWRRTPSASSPTPCRPRPGSRSTRPPSTRSTPR